MFALLILITVGGFMFKLIGDIVLEGLKTFNEERRTRFMDDHHEIITELNRAKNDLTEGYSDDAIMIAKKDLMLFMQSYYTELKGHNNEVAA